MASWLYCFNTYVTVRTSDPLTRDMLAYSRLLIREALSHGGSGWLEYDRIFRRQVSIAPDLHWNTLLPSLQASTIISCRSQNGTFCTLCRECDHIESQCALYVMQQPLQTPVSQSQRSTEFPTRPQRRPETAMHICVAWNKGSCTRHRCNFRHVCATWQLVHRAKDCAAIPENSHYRTRPYPNPPVSASSSR